MSPFRVSDLLKSVIRTWIAAAILLLFVPGAGANVEHQGIYLRANVNWVEYTEPNTWFPVHYTLENNGPAQTVTVFMSAPLYPSQRFFSRTYSLQSGERVSGYFYVQRTEHYYGFHGSIYFEGSRSGALPQQKWVGVSAYSNVPHDPNVFIPRILLVDQQADITGLNKSVENRLKRHSGYSGSTSLPSDNFYSSIGVNDIPTSWIGMSGISMVQLGYSEAQLLGKEAKESLQNYVFSGGILVLVCPQQTEWFRQWWGQHGSFLDHGNELHVNYGLGRVMKLDAAPLGDGQWETFFERLRNLPTLSGRIPGTAAQPQTLFFNHSRTTRPWKFFLNKLSNLPIQLPEFPRMSYGMLWWLMVGFVILVGPVNYAMLKRKKALPLFILTTPVISLIMGGVLLLATLLLEGFKANAMASGFTFLFQPENRALSFQRFSIYSPIGLSLSFPSDTIVQPSFGDFSVSYSGHHSPARDDVGTYRIDMGEGMNLSGDFIRPRLVRTFGSAQIRNERSRLIFNPVNDTEFEVQNGLGVEILSLVYVAPNGNFHKVDNLGKGERKKLHLLSEGMGTESMIGMFQSEYKLNEAPELLINPNDLNFPANSYVCSTTESFGVSRLNKRINEKVTKNVIIGFVSYE